MTFGLTELYSAIRNTIRNTDTVNLARCHAIQTFAVLDEYQQANREQLEKSLTEKYKPFFYSRKWEREGYPSGKMSFEYPLLAIIPQASRYTGLVGGECSTELRIHIAVLDYQNEQCTDIAMNTSYLDSNGNCGCSCLDSRYLCDARNQFEIERDTSELLLNFLRQLSTVGYYNEICDSESCAGQFLTSEYVSDKPDLYAIDPGNSATLRNFVWPNALKDITVESFAGGTNRLHGAVINNLTFTI